MATDGDSQRWGWCHGAWHRGRGVASVSTTHRSRSRKNAAGGRGPGRGGYFLAPPATSTRMPERRIRARSVAMWRRGDVLHGRCRLLTQEGWDFVGRQLDVVV